MCFDMYNLIHTVHKCMIIFTYHYHIYISYYIYITLLFNIYIYRCAYVICA